MFTLFLTLLSRLALAAAAGLLLFSSYEPLGWFVAAWVGAGLLFLSLAPRSSWPFVGGSGRFVPARQRPARWFQRPLFWLVDAYGNLTGRGGFLVGFAHAMTLYLLLLPWIGELVGKMPYIALCIYLALWSGLFGTLIARLGARRWMPWAFAFVYQAIEWARSTFPFGGFAWVRLGWGQVSGPLKELAAWGGPALVGFSTVCVGLALVGVLRADSRRLGAAVLALAAVATGTAWVTGGKAPDSGSVTVAAVQGNVPRLGLDFNAQRRAVLTNHVEETMRIDQPVDMVIWPENASDVSPFTDPQAKALIDQAVQKVDAPILVGTITRDEVGDRNTMVVMDPDTGVGEYHYKKFLQPFGEYMPWRRFFRMITPLVDLASDFKPGDGDGVVHINARNHDNPIAVGIATCYEVAFDAAGRDAVKAGAQILTTPTNNATFGFSDMTYQQLAMSRMRAIELDRSVVVAATSGSSAMILPDGTVTQQTGIFEARHLIESLPLRDTLTFAARYGSYVEYILVIIGTMCAVGALSFRKQRKDA